MEIYVVQQGDTIEIIAHKYGISTEKLITDNGIKMSELVVGQTLVITHPKRVYTVVEGDTLGSIAESYDIPVMQLLMNNPELASRQYIYPGESIVIDYDNGNGEVLATGYTYSFIQEDVLKKTLPYLTYLILFNYRITNTGNLVGSNEDIPILRTADLYDAGVTMVVTAYSQTGEIDLQLASEILLNEQIQDNIINDMLVILKTKGYRGVNMAFQLINENNQQLFLNYLAKVYQSLHPEGYLVYTTINPGLSYNGREVTFEKIDYAKFSETCDGILVMSYDWGSIERPPIQFSIVTTSSLLDYIVAQVPLDKIRIAIPTLGYDWRLPYIEGRSQANVLQFDSVLALANLMKAEINYDESTLSAYFRYIDNDDQQHIVWFKDARSIDSSIKILQGYGIKGIGIWNVMYYFSQLWLVINSQYEIVKAPNLK